MIRLAVLGPAGTFSDVAARQYLKKHQLNYSLNYYNTIEQVAVAASETDQLALLPLENTLDGYVQNTLAILATGQLRINGAVMVPVRFSLAANVLELNKIKRLYVQFKTKGQCTKIIQQLPQAELLTTESNMLSFAKLENSVAGDAAIIPQFHLPELNPKKYLLVSDVTDQSDNFTRFIVVGKKIEMAAIGATNRFRYTCYVTPKSDYAGLLYDILGHFAKAQLNLISLISRPTKKKMGQYSFYIEVSGVGEQLPKLHQVLQQLGKHYTVLDLGVYPATDLTESD
ncbi:prephenate dehydratase [Loigolactobacillus iwatensis]|uniref:prephenate dehydratase n=1 Tax=Loigolactobacillus iwatensis TaxID=1267156 RepID=UPI000F7E10D3|nr:prephenate dehydratase domain-containing protein [Loigolactobacillus iwatensis]